MIDQDAQELLQLAKRMKEELDTRVADPYKGLCYHLRHSSLLPSLFASWLEYSGTKDFPVPSPYAAQKDKEAAQRIYIHTFNMYAGEYGASRRRLLDHIIATLEARL